MERAVMHSASHTIGRYLIPSSSVVAVITALGLLCPIAFTANTRKLYVTTGRRLSTVNCCKLAFISLLKAFCVQLSAGEKESLSIDCKAEADVMIVHRDVKFSLDSHENGCDFSSRAAFFKELQSSKAEQTSHVVEHHSRRLRQAF